MLFSKTKPATVLLAALTIALGQLAAQPAGISLPSQSVVHTTDARDLALIEALNTYIPAVVKVRDFPGFNIALAIRGRIVWEGAYGYADAKTRRAMTTESVFRSGSIGKVLAAISIMQLVERGLLQLDDPINKHLDFAVRNELGGGPVTVRHLLTHTSGIGRDEIDSYLCDDPRAVLPLAKVVRDAFARTPRFTAPTGTTYQYSNLGIGTLGLIVERVNAQRLSYAEYVQKNILDPAGMRFAQFPKAQMAEFVRPDIWERRSTGYSRMGGVWVPATPLCFGLYPCGGMLATPSDYLRLMIAMLNSGALNGHRILNARSVATMLTPNPVPQREAAQALLSWLFGANGEPMQLQQGLVFVLANWDEERRSFQHTGGHFYGWQTRVAAFPGSQTAFVSAENQWDNLWPYNRETVHGRVLAFIDGWLQESRTRPPREFAADFLRRHVKELQPVRSVAAPAIPNLAWKLSYLRGLSYGYSYQGLARGRNQRLNDTQARLVAANTESTLSTWQPSAWDSAGFVAGIHAMAAVAPNPDSIREFAASGRMQITVEEARQLFPLLNPPPQTGGRGGGPGALGGLLQLPTRPSGRSP